MMSETEELAVRVLGPEERVLGAVGVAVAAVVRFAGMAAVVVVVYVFREELIDGVAGGR